MTHLAQGMLQIYTGNGKGKTTAALGLALRALGAKMRVYIGQFFKGDRPSSEFECLKYLAPEIFVHQMYGDGRFLMTEPTQEDRLAAQKGLALAKDAFKFFDVVILDESIYALNAHLFSLEELVSLIDARPKNVELILTGRDAPKALIEKADLVSEMVEVKHYYHTQLPARLGIEF